jgi:hypothetical protein
VRPPGIAVSSRVVEHELIYLRTLLPLSDPFADTHSRPQALDDNPFADTSDPVNPFSNPSNNASAFSLESQTTPVPGGRGAGGFQAQQDDAGYRAREEELRRRDEEVQRRQRELDERERRLDAGEGKANWPFCECFHSFLLVSLPRTQPHLLVCISRDPVFIPSFRLPHLFQL